MSRRNISIILLIFGATMRVLKVGVAVVILLVRFCGLMRMILMNYESPLRSLQTTPQFCRWKYKGEKMDILFVALIAVLVLLLMVLVEVIVYLPNFNQSNLITVGNCAFPLKVYNNMTTTQIENASIACYK